MDKNLFTTKYTKLAKNIVVDRKLESLLSCKAYSNDLSDNLRKIIETVYKDQINSIEMKGELKECFEKVDTLIQKLNLDIFNTILEERETKLNETSTANN